MSTATTREAELHGQASKAEPAGSGPGGQLPPERRGSGRVRLVVVLLVIVLAVAAVVWVIHRNVKKQAAQEQKMAAAANRPTPVQTVAVQQRTMPIYLTALGTVTAYNTVTIKPRVDGQLMSVNVREGQAVRKGQLLVEIDPRPYQAALAQAQGQLAKDQANQKNAQAEAARYTALYQAGVVSKESQQTQLSNAGQASGSIQADQAAIEAARVNLIYTRVTSPVDGVVGLRQVDPGNIVHAADTTGLLVVTQMHPIAVIFTLPEDWLPRVLRRTRAGQELVVDAYDRSGATHLATGKLLTLDNQIDTTTGTVKVKAVFDNHEGMLFPNQFVNVRLVLEEQKDAIVVPVVALQNGTSGSFVYVVQKGEPPADKQDDGAEKHGAKGSSAEAAPAEPHQKGPSYYVEARPVTETLTEGTVVILSAGVKPGDQIVVDGQEKLKDGSRVLPRQAQSSVGTTGGLGASSAIGKATNPKTPVSKFETHSKGETRAIDEPRDGRYGKQPRSQQPQGQQTQGQQAQPQGAPQ